MANRDLCVRMLAEWQEMGVRLRLVGDPEPPQTLKLEMPEHISAGLREEIRRVVSLFRDDIATLLAEGRPGARTGRGRTREGRPGQESG